MRCERRGYNAAMGIINRIMSLITTPFRAITARSGRTGRTGRTGRRV